MFTLFIIYLLAQSHLPGTSFGIFSSTFVFYKSYFKLY